MDVFTWTHELKCPPAICNGLVKKTLHTGLVGFLWDELADIIFNAEEAKTIRKNILLYQLKHGTHNKLIQCVKNISQLKSERNNLKTQINKLKEEYEQQDFTVRQKVKKLQDISSKISEVRARRDLYKMKHDQTATQLHDCNDMKLVWQHLMPSTCKDLDPKVLIEVLDTVTSLWTGTSKREVWNTISNNLDRMEVPTLWHHLYQNLTKDVDSLIKSASMKSMDTDKKSINIGIARIYGQHICMISKQLLYNTRAKKHQQNVLELIEKIEVASNNSADISEWLALELEVCKLESEQINLQEEVDKIRESLYESNIFTIDLSQITSEIQNINLEKMDCIQQIQQSLNLLKAAPTFLMKVKQKINLELEKIATMPINGYDLLELNNDLTTELDMFHEALDLNALRKIILKGDIGVYRHTKSCISEASISVTNSQTSNIRSYFPTVQIPLYSLIDCYKNIILMLTCKRIECLEIEENPSLLPIPILAHKENNYNTVELFKLSESFNTKTKAEIAEFNEILNAWIHQTVQKVMEIIDKTVDDATFSEWIERYDLLLYMLQNST